jgi:NADPH:quinone reductase-like Zn-dependent oxidoreductase
MTTPASRGLERDVDAAGAGSTMRAVVIHQHGGPEVLTHEPDWPRPVAGSGEILIEVRACALNFLDIFAREGMPGEPTPLPQITGGDIAGVVSEVGTDVATPAVGDRVVLNPSWGCGLCEYCSTGETPRCLRPHMLGETDPGGLAEYVKCPAGQAIGLPAGYSYEHAACLPITFGTAWRMVVGFARVAPHNTVLVLGAGGGVAIAAIQIVKLLGARVIATASTDDKLARARSLGADEVINYSRDENWDVTVRQLTGKRGADVIIETVGETTWERSIRALSKGGKLITCGATSGPIAATDIRYVFRREQTIQGINGWTHDDLLHVTSLAFKGRLRPIIDRVLPLARTAEGELALERREVFGKVLIDPTRADVA